MLNSPLAGEGETQDTHAPVDGRCELAEVSVLPVASARRLGCDASVVRVVENDAGEVLDVGRKTRVVPTAFGARSQYAMEDAGFRDA